MNEALVLPQQFKVSVGNIGSGDWFGQGPIRPIAQPGITAALPDNLFISGDFTYCGEKLPARFRSGGRASHDIVVHGHKLLLGF
jgi:hypothetical protein